jgi:hypothetical protein
MIRTRNGACSRVYEKKEKTKTAVIAFLKEQDKYLVRRSDPVGNSLYEMWEMLYQPWKAYPYRTQPFFFRPLHQDWNYP